VRFKKTYRASPVIQNSDLPWEYDLFHKSPEDVPVNLKEYKDYLIDNHIIIDNEWWNEQYDRCLNGFDIPDAIEKGGNAYVDEQDVFWNDSAKEVRYLEDYDYEIPPNSCYIPNYDLLIKNKTIHITGRHYFYLNFWKIFRNRDDVARKDILPPKFIDIDFFFFRRMEMMVEQEKDSLEIKSRQLGYSEKVASMLGYNFTFYRASVNIVVGGQSDDAAHTMENAQRGLVNLINTQFYKERDKSKSDFWRAKHFRSELRSLSAKDNTQSVSRFSPSLLILEECFAKDTKILMANGEFKKIQNIKVGEYVKGENSRAMRVVHRTKGKGPLYKVNQLRGNSYVVNEVHRLRLDQRCNSSYKDDGIKYHTVKQLESLSPYKRRTTYGTKSSGIEYNEKKLILDPYFFGLWLGNGRSVDLTISTKEKEIVDYLYEFARLNMFNINVNNLVNANSAKITISDGNGYPRKVLEKLKIRGNKRIPRRYFINSKRVRLELLAGIIDTDGSLIKSTNSYSFAYEVVKKSKKIITQIIELSRSLGFYVSIIKSKKIKGSEYHRIRITGYINEIPVKVLHKRVPLDYKRTSNPSNTPISIEDYGVGNYYGITLEAYKDEDRVLILEDYTLSMNCGKWQQGFVKELKQFVDVSTQAENKKTGYIVMVGTGGSMDLGAADLEKMAYNPDSVNVLSFKNVFDKDNTIFHKVGHFTGAKYFRVIDEDGNSDTKAGGKAVLEEREKLKSKDKYTHTTQRALYLSDAFMINTGGYFGEDVAMWCNQQISFLRTHPEADMVERGRLNWKDAKDYWKGVYFIPDPEGPFHILEHPMLDNDNKPYLNLYVGGTDSYDQDESYTSTSQGACVIKKRFLNADSTYNLYVAYILERPETAVGGKDVFFEHTAMLTMYYMAKNLIEWSKILIFEWYTRKGLEPLLKERPEFVMSKVIIKSQATNYYGIDPSTKTSWLRLQADYLKDEENVKKCFFPVFLKEWATFKYIPGNSGGKYNSDVVIATSLCETFCEDVRELPVVSEGEFDDKDPMPVYKMDGGTIVQQW